MKDVKRIVEILLLWSFVSVQYFVQGIKKNCFLAYLKNYFKEFFLHLETFSKHIHEYKDIQDLQFSQIERLRVRSEGLHSLLKNSQDYFYSVFIVINHAKLTEVEKTLKSVQSLSAPYMEVLIALNGVKDQSILKLVQDTRLKTPHLKEIVFEEKIAEADVYNELVYQSQGNYFFILGEGDVVRPDILYRYEQTLEFFKEKESLVLYSDDYEVDDNYSLIHPTRSKKAAQPVFPYYFSDFLSNTLLIPKALWNKMGGLKPEADGLQALFIALELDLLNATFEKVPLHLYGINQRLKKFKESRLDSQRKKEIYKRYSLSKNLNWNFEEAFSKNTIRALPVLEKIPTVHVIVLYKDQRNMTLRAVDNIQAQVGVHVKVTAVDNNSQDHSIKEKLEEKNVEVLTIDEPFNYSRLNNLGLERSKFTKDAEYILFLNNDVDLDRNALLEMCRWIDQPSIGLVGCRLNYPNGSLQHGGVIVESSRAAFIKSWHHRERTLKFEDLKESAVLSVVPAVTAACALIRKDVFNKISGFDELWYPVAFSDTSLAVKIRALGLHCFYTPFAVGVHHESVSRNKINIEDYESLTWTHKKFVEHLFDENQITFKDLKNSDY